MKKYLFTFFLALLVLTSCSSKKDDSSDSSKKLKISASFYPLAYFSQKVGGDFVNVSQVVPGGVEPHDYEPSPKELASIENSQIFIMNGGGIDTWGENLFEAGIKTIKAIDKVTLEDADPHIWLSPINAQKEVEAIRDVLIDSDPGNAKDYQQNAEDFLTALRALDSEYRIGLAKCEIRQIITSHDAFGYLAREYEFEAIEIAGISPEEEPSPQAIAEISDLARKNNIKYIFFETLVSPKLAETVAEEIGAESLVLNPLEGLTNDEIENGENYLTVMKQNLKNLQTAMQCQ